MLSVVAVSNPRRLVKQVYKNANEAGAERTLFLRQRMPDPFADLHDLLRTHRMLHWITAILGKEAQILQRGQTLQA